MYIKIEQLNYCSTKEAVMKKMFKVEVDCANCASKMERAILKIDGVQNAVMNFMTQKLTLEAEDDQWESVVKEAKKAMKKVDRDAELYC